MHAAPDMLRLCVLHSRDDGPGVRQRVTFRGFEDVDVPKTSDEKMVWSERHVSGELLERYQKYKRMQEG